jgi:hypothetical protein
VAPRAGGSSFLRASARRSRPPMPARSAAIPPPGP